MPMDSTPTVSFSRQSQANAQGSFLAMGPAPAAAQHRAHGLRVRKQAELMGITPGTSRLTQQTGHQSWVSGGPAAAASANRNQLRPARRAQDVAKKEEVDMEIDEYYGSKIAGAGTVRSNALANDEFYEGDPFEEDEDGHEVGEEDILEWDGQEAMQEEAPLIVPVQKRIEPTRSKALGIKSAAELLPPSSVVTKTEKPDHSAGLSKATTGNRDQLAGWELFKVQRLNEADLRDAGARAICRIKHGVRQPGAQADGRPFIPADWDATFKPILGSFKKFILGRPDQFHITSGGEPGLFTIAIVSHETVEAPCLASKGKGKAGFGKGKAKGKDGKGKDKSKSKGQSKDSKGKGKSKAWSDSKPWATASAPAAAATRTVAAPPTRAARLLAAAAKEALAEEEDEEQMKAEQADETLDFEEGDEAMQEENQMEEDEWPQDDEDGDGAGAFIEDPIERMWQTSPDAAEPEAGREAPETNVTEEAETPAETPVQHGRFMSLLGGLGSKRPGSAGATGAAKRLAV